MSINELPISPSVHSGDFVREAYVRERNQVQTEDDLRKFADRTGAVFHDLAATNPEAAPYVLTNSHRRRVLMTTNLRDLYHFARLREDSHAQWDIRDLATRIGQEVTRAMPLGALLLCGKDHFVERFENVFGRKPQLDPSDLDP